MHEGFEFTKKDTINNITYWTCVKSRKEHCGGKAKTRQMGNRHMMKIYGVHTCQISYQTDPNETGRRSMGECDQYIQYL